MSTLQKLLKIHLRANTLPKFRGWLGHRVEVHDSKGKRWVGKLTYLGASVDKSVLQATIDSTPIFPIKLETLKLI